MIRQRLVTATLSNSAAKVTSVAIWFALTPLLLAQLGPSGYALWVLLAALMSYGALLDCGIAGAVVKYVAEHVARGEHGAARRLVASALWVYLVLGLAVATLSVVIAAAVPGLLGVQPAERTTAVWLGILTGINIAMTIAFAPPVSVLRGLQRYDLFNGVQIFGSVLQAVATVAVLLAGWGLLGLIAINIPVNIAMCAVSSLLIRRVSPDLSLTWRGASVASVRKIASFSSSLFVIDIADRLRSKSDEFVIALFNPLSAVTPYALARRLGELTKVTVLQFLKVMMPLASELEAGDQSRTLRTLYITSSRISLGVAVPVTMTLVILGGPILGLWVGAAYAQHGDLVAVLALASLITTSQWPAVEILQGIAKHRIVATASLAAGIASIALSILLMRWLGLLGVALGGLIPAAVVSFAVVMPFANRTLDVTWQAAVREIWLPGLVPATGAVAVLWALRPRLETASVPVLLSWLAVSVLVYGAGYLSIPASRPERQLLSDVIAHARARALRMRAVEW